MFVVNIPSLLVLGFGIAILFLVLGFRERADFSKRSMFIRIGLDLLGLMVIVTPLSWYGTWALTSGLVHMTILDILIVTVFTALGGLIIGVSVVYEGRG